LRLRRRFELRCSGEGCETYDSVAPSSRVLDGIRDEVVVIGAVAVQVALDGHEVTLTAHA
jgi:hypothetical protein